MHGSAGPRLESIQRQFVSSTRWTVGGIDAFGQGAGCRDRHRGANCYRMPCECPGQRRPLEPEDRVGPDFCAAQVGGAVSRPGRRFRSAEGSPEAPPGPRNAGPRHRRPENSGFTIDESGARGRPPEPRIPEKRLERGVWFDRILAIVGFSIFAGLRCPEREGARSFVFPWSPGPVTRRC